MADLHPVFALPQLRGQNNSRTRLKPQPWQA
jgi:hypothetical protein